MAEKSDKNLKMGNSGSDLWSITYNEIKNKHDAAFVAIEQAISLEEQEKPNEAIQKYKDGITLIDEALNIQVQCPDSPDKTWEKACEMIQKIKKTRAEVLCRINSIHTSPTFVSDDPPSYEEAVSPTSEQAPITYKDLATALNELSFDPNHKINEEIVYMHEGVRLYFISPNGEVLATELPQTLKISLVEGAGPNAPRAILQIGEWVYPLVPGVSPCYRTDYGAFILPDVYAQVPGSSIGIILPSEADEALFDLLENILHGIISQEKEQEIAEEKRKRKEPEDVSTKISNSLVNGAWFLSKGLIRGAEKVGDLMTKGTPKVIENMNPAEQPTSIPEPVSKTIKIAKNTTSTAAKVTGVVADKVGIATMRLGKFLAPHIQKQGTRLLTNGFRMSEQEASEKVKGVLTVAAGAVEGFSTIYRGLETSASILGRNLKDNTVKIVKHKYGVPASSLTGDTFTTVGNVYGTYQNTKIFTPKGLVKQTAKDTGRAVVYDYTTSARASEAFGIAGPSSTVTLSQSTVTTARASEALDVTVPSSTVTFSQPGRSSTVTSARASEVLEMTGSSSAVDTVTTVSISEGVNGSHFLEDEKSKK